MHLEAFRDFCLALPAVTEHTPFGPDVLVFKVGSEDKNKMFALAPMDDFSRISLKCEPELALQLREEFPEVVGAYHMNKKHWNSLPTTGELSDAQLKHWIGHSYQLVRESLPKKVQAELPPLPNA